MGDTVELVENAAYGPVNSEYLADAGRRKPRHYGLIGAYARATFWSLAVMALAFGVFMVLHAI